MVKKSYKVLNMHCASCALLISSDLEDLNVKAKCSYAKSILEVEYDEKRISESLIHKTVANLGYTLA